MSEKEIKQIQKLAKQIEEQERLQYEKAKKEGNTKLLDQFNIPKHFFI